MITVYTTTGIAKVSGILEGRDFNVKSVYERLKKGLKKEGLKNKMQRKYLDFFYLIIQFKERKKRGSGHSKQFEWM